MSDSHDDTLISAEARQLALCRRRDVTCERQTYQGEISWVVKDPISLRYYRLKEEQYALWDMLDGQVTLEQLKDELQRRFPQLRVTYSRIQSLLWMLHRSGLLISKSIGQGQQLWERDQKERAGRFYARWLSILWIRLPGVDPDRFLARLYPFLRWLYQPAVVTGSLLLMISALLLVTVQFQEFSTRLPAFHEFFAARNIAWLMVTLALTKVLHELGHGLTCKHFGGECHQMGIMFLVFTPCLYCDTSDAWMLPSKWHRAAIDTAGMYVELILASIATWIWWYSEPGLLHYLCLSTMFVCSVSALLFNANPLLRYDGYYILSDLVEVPNLAHRSRTALLGILRSLCLGLPWDKESTLPPRQRGLFAAYALASVCYRWMVLILILWFLSTVFAPYGLEPIGHLAIAVTLIGSVVLPLWKSLRYLAAPGRMRQVKKPRLFATSLVVTACVILACFTPLPHRVMAPVTVEPHNAERVYVNVAGTLSTIDVIPGDAVAERQTLASLSSPELELKITELQGQRARLARRLTNLRRQQGQNPRTVQAIPQTQEAFDNLEERLRRLVADRDRLQLVSQTTGVVMPPEERLPESTSAGDLLPWSGTPLQKWNQGCRLETGTLFCLVGDPTKMEGVLIIDQTDIGFIRSGQSVDIQLDEYPGHVWAGTIEEIAQVDLQVAPRHASGKAGGDLNTQTDERGMERPTSVSYQVRVPLGNDNDRLQKGFRGRAKIHVGSRSLAQSVWRWLLETFRFG